MAIRQLQPIKARIPVLVAILLAIVVLVWMAGKCTNDRRSPFTSAMPIKSGGDTLDVVIEISPLSYSLANDTISGLDYDMLREICAGWRPVKFHPMVNLEYGLEGLRNGNFDVLISALPSTSALKDSLLLTDRVYLDHEVLVQRRDDPGFAHTADALGGDTVWIADSSPFAERIRNLSDEIGDTIIVQSKPGYSAEYLVMLVADGQLRRAVVNHGIASRMLADYPGLDASTSVSFTQFQVWAIAPGRQDLLKAINARLASLRKSPRYQDLLNHYIAH